MKNPGEIISGYYTPEFLGQTSYLTFGRVRPMHVNGVAFGFLSTGLIGAAYYIVQRLTGTKLFSEKLGNLTFVLWNLAVASGFAGEITEAEGPVFFGTNKT